MPYMMIDHQKVFVPQNAKYIELDDQLVRTPWSGLASLGANRWLIVGLIAGGILGTWIVLRRRKRTASLAGDYSEIVATKAAEAIRTYREEAHDARQRADAIERAWQDWDFDALVDLNVVGHDTAQAAEKERREEMGCGYCGSEREPSMDVVGGDWPRCPDCGGC